LNIFYVITLLGGFVYERKFKDIKTKIWRN